jgi:hypothetical protein
MAWEWLAPAATIVGSGITAGFGGWVGGRLSHKQQGAQHQFEREQALTAYGRDKIDDAVSAFRFIQHHAREFVDDDLASPIDESNTAQTLQERIARAVPYITDAAVRADVELAHELLDNPWVVEQYGGGGSSRSIVWQACRGGRLALERYLRGEPRVPSKELDDLRQVQAEAYELQNEIYEQDAADDRAKRQLAAQNKAIDQAEPPPLDDW